MTDQRFNHDANGNGEVAGGEDDFEIVDALKEGTDGTPVEITESGLTLNLGMGEDEEYNDAAPQEVSPEELQALGEVEDELNQRWPETKIEPTLERIEMLMDLLGHPEQSFDVIHIAGTNGKSSTARMVDSLLRSFHRRVGLVTSPHLQRVTERIGIDGRPIHPRDYVRLWHEIKPYVEMVDARSEVPMSKFEVLVAYPMQRLPMPPLTSPSSRSASVGRGMPRTWSMRTFP